MLCVLLEDIHQYVAPVGVFVQLRKENISFVTSLYLSLRPSFCLSVCPHATPPLALGGFSRNFNQY